MRPWYVPPLRQKGDTKAGDAESYDPGFGRRVGQRGQRPEAQKTTQRCGRYAIPDPRQHTESRRLEQIVAGGISSMAKNGTTTAPDSLERGRQTLSNARSYRESSGAIHC